MTQPEPAPDTTIVIERLTKLYEQAMHRSGLPYRSPSHRIAEQLVATGEAAASAQALAFLTGAPEWARKAAERKRNLRDRVQMSQTDIDLAERSESTLRRYGLRGLR